MQRGAVGENAAQLGLGDRLGRPERFERREDVGAESAADPEGVLITHARLPVAGRHRPMVKATGSSPDRPDGMRSVGASVDGASVDAAVKFAAPVANRLIDRPRLHGLLNAARAHPVTVIAATAGWGKTLLAASWIAASADDRPAAWVNLDAGDDDPQTFWRTVAGGRLGAGGRTSPARGGRGK